MNRRLYKLSSFHFPLSTNSLSTFNLLPKQIILVPRGFHRCPADKKSRLALKDASFNKIGANEVDGRTENPIHGSGLFLSVVIGLCVQFGKVEQLFFEGFRRVVGIMQEVAVEQGLLGFALVF